MAICYKQWPFFPAILFVANAAVHKLDMAEPLAAPASVACELRLYRENQLDAQATMWKTMMTRMSDQEWLAGWQTVSPQVLAEVRHVLCMSVQTWLWTQPVDVVRSHYPFVDRAEWVKRADAEPGELVVHLVRGASRAETAEMRTLREHAGLEPHQMRFASEQRSKRRRTGVA